MNMSLHIGTIYLYGEFGYYLFSESGTDFVTGDCYLDEVHENFRRYFK